MFYLLLIAGIMSRLTPHLANLTPVGAILIFGTKKIGAKEAALLGLLIMVITDLFLGTNFVTIFVYIGFAGYIFASRLPTYISPFVGSVWFFIVSNLGVYLQGWYGYSLAGFVKCFVLAIPFYRNTIIGDIIFTAAIFGAYYLVNKYLIKEGAKWRSILARASFNKK